MSSMCLAQTAVRGERVACQLEPGHEGEHEAGLGYGRVVAWWNYSPPRVDQRRTA